VLLRSARTRQKLQGVWLKALVLAAGYTLYQFVQILVVGSRRSAVDRATWLWTTEQHLHVDPEVWLNHFVAERYGLVVVTGLYYGILHFAFRIPNCGNSIRVGSGLLESNPHCQSISLVATAREIVALSAAWMDSTVIEAR
jgi:hypothetical protein